VCAPKQTTLQQIVEVAGQRWRVEEAIERAKEACGLDQYEVRSWTGWYRHITLSLLAQFCATLMMDQANAEQEKKAREPKPGPSSLQHFTSRRGLAVG
jgi:SRSO17 transposase